VFAGLLLCSGSGTALADSVSSDESPEVPDAAQLAQMPRGTSIFLLAELALPEQAEGSVTTDRGISVRRDYFQEGRLTAARELKAELPVCFVLTVLDQSEGPGGHSERPKRFEVRATRTVSPLAGSPGSATTLASPGWELALGSVQETSVAAIGCYGPSSSPADLTLGSLRAAFPKGLLAVIPPLGWAPAPPAASNASRGGPVRFHEALTERPPPKANPDEISGFDRVFIRLVKWLVGRGTEKKAAPQNPAPAEP
jgi:hypothetical protein